MVVKSKRRTESSLEARCVKWARMRGVLVSKLTDPTGAPDRAFWVPGGKALLVEFKDPRGAPASLQSFYQEAFRSAGYSVTVVRTQTHFRDLMKVHGVEE